ncbi:MAG TPA: alpha/beta hydrolase-fold protein [Anaerolineae bacterium]
MWRRRDPQRKRRLILWLIFAGSWLPACTVPPTLPTRAATATLPTSSPAIHSPTHPPNQPTNRPIDQSTNRPIDQPTNQPTPSPTRCTTPGQVQTGVFSSYLAGLTAYRIYLPPCYGLDGRLYPTLYLLPGNIHDDAIWDDLGVDEAAEAAIINQAISPLLIVMADGGPLANNTSGGPNSYEALVLDELIPFIEATYCAWPDAQGRAIGGISRGGYWALEIAFRHPDRFTSVGGHSAALLDVQAGPDVNPEYTGLHNALGNLRIYFDIGRDDYLLANIQRLHEEMEATGIAHTWILNDGRHENAYWSAHVANYLLWYAAPWPPDRKHYPPCG